MTTFKDLGLAPKLLDSITTVGYETPTPIQEQAIPLVMEGHDLMGLAQTGTGKTAAFGLPLVHKLMEEGIKPKPKSVRALILAPTRELVNQISENLRQYVKKTPIWVNVVIGGASIGNQARVLSKGTDILVATPGRLLDLAERNAVHLDTVNYLVLDEADQMLDLGFIHSLRKIAKMLGTPRQTLLFSATMPKQVEDLSKAFLNDPVRVQVSPPGKAADKIEQSVHHISARDKTNLLKDCLIKHDGERTLVFARTKHGAEKLMKHLVECGFKADSIHGNKSQGQRDRAIRSFKKQDIDILVATDVAARGIDIPGVSYVYNFNLPEVPENYVHRIGRTARAGAEGKAVAFCAPDEMRFLKQIEKLMSISISVESGTAPERMPAAKPANNNRSRGRNGKPARGSGDRDNKGRDANRGERNAKPRRDGEKRSWSNDNREENRSENRFDKPKKFKNKQMSISEFEAKEQRRKDRPKEEARNDKPRHNSGERSRDDIAGSHDGRKGKKPFNRDRQGENATGKRNASKPQDRNAKKFGQSDDRSAANKGKKTWRTKTTGEKSGFKDSGFKGKGGKPGSKSRFSKPTGQKSSNKRPQKA